MVGSDKGSTTTALAPQCQRIGCRFRVLTIEEPYSPVPNTSRAQTTNIIPMKPQKNVGYPSICFVSTISCWDYFLAIASLETMAYSSTQAESIYRQPTRYSMDRTTNQKPVWHMMYLHQRNWNTMVGDGIQMSATKSTRKGYKSFQRGWLNFEERL